MFAYLEMVYPNSRGNFYNRGRGGNRPSRFPQQKNSATPFASSSRQDTDEGSTKFKSQNELKQATNEDHDGSNVDSSEAVIKQESEDPIAAQTITSNDDFSLKFNGRCRLFVGNVPMNLKLDEFEALFTPYGDTAEAYLSDGKGFGFIRMVGSNFT